MGRRYKKYPPPDRIRGGIRNVFHGSTLVAALGTATHWRINGRTRQAISNLQLGSGVVHRQGGRAIAANRLLSGLLSGYRVFVTAFPYRKNLSHFSGKVNPHTRKKRTRKGSVPPLQLRQQNTEKGLHNHINSRVLSGDITRRVMLTNVTISTIYRRKNDCSGHILSMGLHKCKMKKWSKSCRKLVF